MAKTQGTLTGKAADCAPIHLAVEAPAPEMESNSVGPLWELLDIGLYEQVHNMLHRSTCYVP
jgi:hypothetical protein